MQTVINNTPYAAVALTVYEWVELLAELDRSISVVNRDTSWAKLLYERIANQLSDTPVIVK